MPKTLKESNRTIKELNTRAKEAFEKGNDEYGVDLFLQILELEPHLDEVRVQLRELQMKNAMKKKANHSMSSLKGMGKTMSARGALKKDPTKALNIAEELLKLDFLNPSFLELYCDAAEALELPEAAAITLDAVTRHDQKNETLLERLGHLQMKAGNSHGAVDAFQKLGELRPNDQTIIKLIKDASATDTMKKSWEGNESYRDGLKDKDEAENLEQQARAQHSEDDLEDIVRTQRLRLQHEPDNMNIYRPLAENLLKIGEYDEALEILEKASEKTGGADPMIMNSISNATRMIYEHNITELRKDGQEDAAQEEEVALKTFLMTDAAEKVERYPNDLGYKFDYGQLLLKEGHLDKAIGQFQQSQRNPQRRISSLFHLGECFKSKGLHDLAASQLQLAAEELPLMDDLKKSVLYELGEVMAAQGKTAEALDLYKQIFSIDIGYKDVAQKVESGYTKPSDA